LPHLVTQPNGGSEVAALARERIADLKTNRALALARTNGAAQYRPYALDDAWHEPIRLEYSSSILPGAESIDFA
jgi:hypothetical protein